MTSDNITRRNRANALKSTGPRSARGKAAVAQNARQHGATSKPDPTSVAAWLRIILNTPNLDPSDFLRDDGRTSSALALAEAEVRLGSARAALDQFEQGDAPPSDSIQDLQMCAENITESLQESSTTAKQLRSGLMHLRRIAKMAFDETAHGGSRHRLLRRYVREARGHHKRAFQAWLASLNQTSVPTDNMA